MSNEDLTPELSEGERLEVDRLLKTQGWLAARDYLRQQGYSVGDANRIVLPGSSAFDRGERAESRSKELGAHSSSWLQSILNAIYEILRIGSIAARCNSRI